MPSQVSLPRKSRKSHSLSSRARALSLVLAPEHVMRSSSISSTCYRENILYGRSPHVPLYRMHSLYIHITRSHQSSPRVVRVSHGAPTTTHVCVRVCTCVCVNVCMHAHVCLRVHACTGTWMNTDLDSGADTPTHTHTHTHHTCLQTVDTHWCMHSSSIQFIHCIHKKILLF